MLKENVAQSSFTITVSDPTTSGEGRTKHTSYLVEVPGKTSARRRYSDFQWLYQALLEELPGCLVPLIPHKTAMRGSVRFSEELVEQRTLTLQAFMTRIAQHPELSESVALQKFLTAYEEEWTKLKAGYVPATEDDTFTDDKKSSLSSWVTKARAKLATAVGMELETTPDDVVFAQLEQYITTLLTNIKAMQREAIALAKTTKDRALALEQMGTSMANLGNNKFPQAYSDTLATMFGKLAEDVAEMAGILTKYSALEESELEEQVNLLVLEVMSAKIVIEQRKTLLWDYTRKVNNVRKQRVNMDRGNISADEVEVIRKEAANVWNLIELVSKRVQREMDIWRNTFESKVRHVLEAFVKKTAEHNALLSTSWTGTVCIVSDNSKEETYTPPAMPTEPPPSAPPVATDNNGVVVSI